jgi:hypothetical protein
MLTAVLFYDVVLSVHIAAIVIAFGVTFTYPVLGPPTVALLAGVYALGPERVALSAEYVAVSKRTAAVGGLANLLVLVAIFFMAAKPFA